MLTYADVCLGESDQIIFDLYVCSLSLFAQCGTRSEVCCQKIYQGKGLNIHLICEVPKYEILKVMHQWCGEIRLFGVRGGC